MVRPLVYQCSNPVPIDTEGSIPSAFFHASVILLKTKTNSSQISIVFCNNIESVLNIERSGRKAMLLYENSLFLVCVGSNPSKLILPYEILEAVYPFNGNTKI